MTKAITSLGQLEPGDSGAASLRGWPGIRGYPLQLLESSGGPGEVSPPPVPQLVLGQVLGQPFRYQCDLGAGRFGGRGMPLDFVVAVPNVATWCRGESPHRLRFVGVPLPLVQQYLGSASPDFGALHARHNRDPLIAHILDALWEESGFDDQASALFAETAVASLLMRLQRLSGQVAEQELARGGLAAWQSERIVSYMHAHLHRPVSLSELAALVDLSPWHFARAFRVRHGVPPHRFLIHLRLEKARDLLVRSPLSITEIASLTGYSSQHLARHFRQQWGCTPGDYRRARRH